jgi:hypothetical protein
MPWSHRPSASPRGAACFGRLPRRGLALLITLVAFAGAVQAEPNVPREERIKAVLIFKILKFVNWPASALAVKDPLVICMTGESPMAEALTTAEGRLIGEHPIQQRKVSGLSPADLKGCHVYYLPAGQRDWNGAAGAINALRGRPLLTVSDGPDFARKGGVIGLVRGENRIGFEVSLKTARENGLEIGAPLLELATLVD